MRDIDSGLGRLGIIVAVSVAVAAKVPATDDPAQSLRERHLGADGLPSEIVYQRAHGVAPVPASERYSWRVVFRITYRSEDLDERATAPAVATDCYLVRKREYVAPRRSTAVWDGRVYASGRDLVVAAFSHGCEQAVGRIVDGRVVFSSAIEKRAAIPLLAQSALHYNPFSGQLWRSSPGGPIAEERWFFLPFPLVDRTGRVVRPRFEIVRDEAGGFELVVLTDGENRVLARTTSRVVARAEGYRPETGEGCRLRTTEPTTTLEIEGELVEEAARWNGAVPLLQEPLPTTAWPVDERPEIDGDFSEWRNVAGIRDPRGDIPGYLQYTPDTDLLEFKVRSDAEALYFYTRVAGRHGHTRAGDRRDRYYYYVYIDADRDATTGYTPTRDDDCYYGVTLGDDCEAQFEFVGGRFVKTFYGFTGKGTEEEVLAGRVELAPSWYSKRDKEGRLRDRYKVEYVEREGGVQITADHMEGTCRNIVIALSPDGSECEMRAALVGFLRRPDGGLVIGPGQQVDLAVGVEAAGKVHGNQKWGADSTAAIRGHPIPAH